jgi:hypothetical protein
MRIGFVSDVICADRFLRSPHCCGTASLVVRELQQDDPSQSAKNVASCELIFLALWK